MMPLELSVSDATTWSTFMVINYTP
jgi:hypothetical protein